ncbi:hypothetical protein [Streptomyces sp. NPDC093990]|uniref:hypothetical protein n=1 Tax=Streptomyces sp. NPDC093990 TaxID=3155306 RepID=UPI003442A2B6
MTWSAAFPGAVARVLRAVGGRRALHVGLLVGGLFVLGFLCGEQAHAADGVGAFAGRAAGQPVRFPAVDRPLRLPAASQAPHTAAATGADTETNTDTYADTAKGPTPQPVTPEPVTPEPVTLKPPAPQAAAPDTSTHPADGKAHRPVTEDVIGTVADGVVRPVGDLVPSVGELVQPVGDLVETVTTGLTGTIGIPAEPTLPGWPTLPSYPESPSWPALPTVPGAPTLPGLPGIPGQTLPVPTPVTSAPQPQPGKHAAEQPDAGDEGPAADSAVQGPRFAGHGTVTEPGTRPTVHRATATTTTAHPPAHQAPSDKPDGTLGGKSAVDNGSSRHGDAHAITPDHRAPLRLVPGAAASVDAAGTRDRHRDIPVFPG